MAVKINNQGSHIKISSQGSAGPQGPQGDQGEQGPMGPQGPQGEQGQVGPAGADGADGINGADGADGAQGPAGPAGAQGDQGIQGPAGVAGPAGPQGPAGADGADGSDGVDGADGADGSDAVVNLGSPTDIDGVVFGDGSNLDAATAAELREAAELDTSDSPTFAGLELDSTNALLGSRITSPTYISITPNGANPSTESLRIGSGSGEVQLDCLGQDLTLSADNADKLTLDSTGLVCKGDLLSDSSSQNIGNSSTGRFGDAFADNLDLSGSATQGGNAVLDESYFTPQTLTDGATIAYDVSSGVNAKVTLGGDRTLAAITNAAEGQSGSLTVIQDATGGRALTLDASQTDMLGTLADIAGMGANEECEIAWRKTDSTNCKFWITIPA